MSFLLVQQLQIMERKQVLEEQELLIGIQLQKLQHLLQCLETDFLQILHLVHLI